MASYVDLVNAAYAFELSDEAWVHELARRVSARFGLPAAVYTVRPERRGRDRIGAIAGAGQWRDLEHAAVEFHTRLSPQLFERAYAGGPFANLLSERIADFGAGDELQEIEAMSVQARERWSATDFLGIYGGSRHGGCMLTLPASTRGLAPRTRWALRRVAVHVAAAFRLREAGLGDPEALLDEQGNILDGSVDVAPQVLSRAAAAMSANTTAERAVAIWQGLVQGQWSLVRTVDRGGRRHLVLRRNEIEEAHGDDARTRRVASVVALAGRGHSNKLIAYELGIPISTVASDLRVGLQALGMNNRASWVRASR
jgi:hypothetical protein